MRSMRNTNVEPGDLMRGLIAGVVSGLAGAWMMNQYHTLVRAGQPGNEQESQGGREAGGQEIGSSRGEQGHRRRHGDLPTAREVAHRRLGMAMPPEIDPEREQQPAGSDPSAEQEPATEKVATTVAGSIFNRELNDKQRKAAGSAVHYAFGAAMGGLYGVLAEVTPGVRKGSGATYGAAVWLSADEVVVPSLGLSKKPADYPPSTHLNALFSHILFGITVEWVRRALRAVL